MSQLTDTFSAIANTIRSKLGVSTTYKPSQMAGAIDSMRTSGACYPPGLPGRQSGMYDLDINFIILTESQAHAITDPYWGSGTRNCAMAGMLQISFDYHQVPIITLERKCNHEIRKTGYRVYYASNDQQITLSSVKTMNQNL